MSTPPVTLSADATLGEAAEIMLEKDIGSVLCVNEEGDLVGILCDSDFGVKGVGVPFSSFHAPQVLGRWMESDSVERIYQEARTQPVAEIMSKSVYTVDETATLEDVLEVMFKRKVKHVPVMRGNRPVGVVARHDLLRLLHERLRG